ncbi:hypothetical protein HYV49_04285 [Candidatus Pacearchaeota archaeon]|nr:hypothetical protein [Candidatus Pacearchaeota archaeon]
MKKVIILLAALIFIFSVYATEFEELLEIGKPKTFSGKTITMKFIGEGEVFIKIDKSEGWFKENQLTVMEGVTIRVKSIAYKINKAWMNISVPFNCGNNVCESNESEGYCCKDCGCVSSSFVCIENQCVHESRNECSIENQTRDCNDNSTCTLDTCQGVPRICFHESVGCKNGDGCCAPGCDNKNDNDCSPPPKCSKDNETIECDDKNPCTRDYCDIECRHEETGKCIDGDFCFKVGEIRELADTLKQCSETGEWVYGEENIISTEGQSFLLNRIFSSTKSNIRFILPVVIVIIAVAIIVLFVYFKKKSESLSLIQKRIDIIKEHIGK